MTSSVRQRKTRAARRRRCMPSVHNALVTCVHVRQFPINILDVHIEMYMHTCKSRTYSCCSWIERTKVAFARRYKDQNICWVPEVCVAVRFSRWNNKSAKTWKSKMKNITSALLFVIYHVFYWNEDFNAGRDEACRRWVWYFDQKFQFERKTHDARRETSEREELKYRWFCHSHVRVRVLFLP